jgi:phosphoglycerate kinase
MKTLGDFNFKDKRVLLRTDVNSDVKDKKVLMSERIEAASQTIKYLLKKKAKVIVIAHQGRPGKEDFLDLSQHAKLLNKYVKIKFIPDLIGDTAEHAIESLKPGEAILLDNLRNNPDEFEPDKQNNSLIILAKNSDFYVNDAFSVCHRKESSIVLFPKYLKSCAGLILDKEVKALQKINVKNSLYILGGAKPEDNIKLLKGNKVLACGLFGQSCLIAKGKSLGYQEEYLKKTLKDYDSIIKELKPKMNNVVTPIDFAIKQENNRTELDLEKFPINEEIFDIGTKTQELFLSEIKKAKAIYMKGPAGDCSDKQFATGTFAILKAIAANKNAFSLIGGGHLSDAIRDSKIPVNKFNHISLSGGALLSYIAGQKLPGLIALGIK